MATDNDEHIVLELRRGETDVLRITRRRWEDKPFTDLRVFFKGTDGLMHPTKKGTSIRDRELHEVIGALQRIAGKVSGSPTTTAPTAQRELPGTRRQPQDSNTGAVSSDEQKMAEELF